MSNYLIIGNINGDVGNFLKTLFKYLFIMNYRIHKLEVSINENIIYSIKYVERQLILYDNTKEDISKLIEILQFDNIIRIQGFYENGNSIDIIPINQMDFKESILKNYYIFIVGNVFNINKQDVLLYYLMNKFKLCMEDRFNIMINSNDIDYIQQYIKDLHITDYYNLYSDYWDSRTDIVVAHRDIIDNCVKSLKEINENKLNYKTPEKNNFDYINKINKTSEYKKCIISINATIDQLLESLYKGFKKYNNFYDIYTKNTSYSDLIKEQFDTIDEYYRSDKYYDDEFIDIYDVVKKKISNSLNDDNKSVILNTIKFNILYLKLLYKIINLNEICKTLSNDFLDYIDRYNLTFDNINNICDTKIKIIKDIIDDKITPNYITLFNSSDLSYDLKIINTEKILPTNQKQINNHNTIIRQYEPKFSFDINDLIYFTHTMDIEKWDNKDQLNAQLYKAKLYKYHTTFNELAVKITTIKNEKIDMFLNSINESLLEETINDQYNKMDKTYNSDIQNINKITNENIFYICIKSIKDYINNLTEKKTFQKSNYNDIKINNMYEYFYKYYKFFYPNDYEHSSSYKNYDHKYKTKYIKNEIDKSDIEYGYNIVKYKNGKLTIYSRNNTVDTILTKKEIYDSNTKQKIPYNYMFVNKINILPNINKTYIYNTDYTTACSLYKDAIVDIEKNAKYIYVVNNNNVCESFIFGQWDDNNHKNIKVMCSSSNNHNYDIDKYKTNIYNLYNDITCLQVLINNCIEFIQHQKYNKKQIIKYFLFIIYAYFSKIDNSNYQIFNDPNEIFNDIKDMIKLNNTVYDNTQLTYKNKSDEYKNISLNKINEIITTFLNIDNDVMKQLYKKSELMHDNYKAYINYMNFTNHDIYDVSASVKFTYKNIYSLMNNYSSIKYYKLLQNYIDNKSSCKLNMNTINNAIIIMYLYVNQIIAQNEEIYYKIHKITKAEYILIIKILSKIIYHIPCLFIDLLCNLKDNDTDKIYNYTNDKITITGLKKDINIIVNNPKLKELKNGTLENDIQINNQDQMYTYKNDYDITYDNDGNISFTIKP